MVMIRLEEHHTEVFVRRHVIPEIRVVTEFGFSIRLIPEMVSVLESTDGIPLSGHRQDCCGIRLILKVIGIVQHVPYLESLTVINLPELQPERVDLSLM